MTRNIEFSIGEFFHLYNRGVDKRIIFDDINDYDRFMVLLYLCNSIEKVDIGDYQKQGLTLSDFWELEKSDTLVEIGSYCLMPNHFHILAREKVQNGISLFMQKLTTAYTMYFNKKNNRTGSLFQGTFKGRHAMGDNYLKYLFAYIGLNPVKLIDKTWKEEGIKNLAETKKFLADYKFSSFIDHCGSFRIEKSILNLENFPEYFQSHKEFKDFINDWLNYREEEV
ncbi:MAG: transposase [Patescibacteria group bacterium]